MNMALGKGACHKAVPAEAPASNTFSDEWQEALAVLNSRTDAHQAALCFTKCCTILQAQIDEKVITTEQHAQQRAELMRLWAERVRQIEQPGAITVVDQRLSD
jgi:hypothetical protein